MSSCSQVSGSYSPKRLNTLRFFCARRVDVVTHIDCQVSVLSPPPSEVLFDLQFASKDSPHSTYCTHQRDRNTRIVPEECAAVEYTTNILPVS